MFGPQRRYRMVDEGPNDAAASSIRMIYHMRRLRRGFECSRNRDKAARREVFRQAKVTARGTVAADRYDDTQPRRATIRQLGWRMRSVASSLETHHAEIAALLRDFLIRRT